MAPANRSLGRIALALLVLAFASILLIPAVTSLDLRPGTPLGQIVGIAAALLLLATLRYPFVRRSERAARDKPGAQRLHALIGSVGVSLALVHSQAALREWSALVLLAALGLLASGLYGRLVAPQRVAGRFGAGAMPYMAADSPDPWAGDEARGRLRAKRELLAQLDSRCAESRFVLRFEHWLRHPRLAWSYRRHAGWERGVHARQPGSAVAQAALADRFWRRSHLVLSLLFVAGLIAHLVTVLFFAGYVADGREIYWWHFTR